MTENAERPVGPAEDPDDLGYSGLPLCREPWESYYILRRGILPCCYGNPIDRDMEDWKAAWNSETMRKIRSCLGQGKLSPYCLESPGCPIVHRILTQKELAGAIPRPPLVLRWLNRLLFRIPGKVYRAVRDRHRPR